SPVGNGQEVELKFPKALPLAIVNKARFDLTDPRYIKWLKKQIKAMEAVLVVLDPLYMMCPGVDENDNAAVIPVLRSLLDVKNETGAGTLLVHHYKKQD